VREEPIKYPYQRRYKPGLSAFERAREGAEREKRGAEVGRK
jgi:hypothetical protein